MAATPYLTLDDVVVNMIYQCEVSVLLAPLVADLEAFRLLYVAVLAATMVRDDRHRMLRLLTGCTVALNSDLNCYPRGAAEIVCFDLDGNEVP